MIPELRRQRYVDFCELKASLVFRTSSRTARTTQKPSLKRKKKEEEESKQAKENSVLVEVSYFPLKSDNFVSDL